MGLSKQELDELRELRLAPDDNNIRYKDIIKHKLLDNNKIIYLINNKELIENDAEPDEYYNVNILPFYLIAPTQSNVQNFICYETVFEDVSRGNSIMKTQQIIFYILCHKDTLVVDKIGVARHDLLASVIKQMFQGCNDFGNQLKLMEDKPSVVDAKYNARTLIFEQYTTNSIVNQGKTISLRNGYR